MNSISGAQWQHTIQHSLPLGLSLLHLKLRPRGRQTAQHISWSQGRSTSPLISKSILWTSTLVWTTPDTIQLYYSVVKLWNILSDILLNYNRLLYYNCYDLYLMFYKYLSCVQYDWNICWGSFICDSYLLCLAFSLYSSGGFSYCFLKNTLLISHGH